MPVISASDPEALRNSVGYQVEGGWVELISSCRCESMVTFVGADGGLSPKAGLGHSGKEGGAHLQRWDLAPPVRSK